MKSKEYHDRKTRNYEAIEVGARVTCQNVKSKKWDKSGLVTEALPHRQYQVKMDGSGRVSLRNRIHLRPLLHVPPHLPNKPIVGNERNVSPGSTSTISS